jgi:hypothetical protein
MRKTLVDPTKPLPVHPVFGRAIGWRNARPGEATAQPFWTQAGGADDDGAGDGTGDGDGDGGDGDDSGDDGDDADDDKKSKGGKDTPEDKVVPQSKYDQIKKQLSEADKKKSAAERELAAIRNKDKPEVDRVTAERDEAIKDRDTVTTNFTALARKYAFVATSNDLDINWVNTGTALRVADLDDLEIGADGTVEGMAVVLKQLAKDHPYLLKVKETDDDGDDGKTKKTPVKSGSAGVGKSKGKAPEGTLSDEELRKRFPSLRI